MRRDVMIIKMEHSFRDGMNEGLVLHEIMSKILDKQIELGMLPPHNDKEGYSSEEWLENMEWESEDD